MDFMLLAIFMFFIGWPLILIFIGLHLVGIAKRMAERQNKKSSRYPVEQTLQDTYESEEGIWPPSPYDAPD